MQQHITDNFPSALFGGLHDFDSHTIKLAFYESDATLSRLTTEYSSDNEVSSADDPNYSAGGFTLTATIGTDYEPNGDLITFVSVNDIDVSNNTFTAKKALCYNSSLSSNNAICVFEFENEMNFTVITDIQLSSAGINLIGIIS